MEGKNIEPSKAKCTKLAFKSAVNFAKEDPESGISGFDIDAYTGAVVDRWWGKLVISVDGITANQQLPIFRNHNSSEIVGYSTETSTNGTFRVKGSFSKITEAAREVQALAEEGFPWQASIGVRPLVVMEIAHDSSLEVNGQVVSGPGEVWLESEVYETSFVPLGADSSTSVEIFSEQEKSENKTNNKKRVEMDLKDLNAETLKTERPDLVELLVSEKLEVAKKEGADVERARIKAVHEQCFPGFEDIVETAMFDGVSHAGDVAMQINTANREALARAASDSSSDAPEELCEPNNNGQLASKSKPETKENAQSKFNANQELQNEFVEFENYWAYTQKHPGVNVRVKG